MLFNIIYCQRTTTPFDAATIEYTAAHGQKPYKIKIAEAQDTNGDRAIKLAGIERLIKNKKSILTLLSGDGDFRSEECIALLKEADIVVPAPPFSLLGKEKFWNIRAFSPSDRQ